VETLFEMAERKGLLSKRRFPLYADTLVN